MIVHSWECEWWDGDDWVTCYYQSEDENKNIREAVFYDAEPGECIDDLTVRYEGTVEHDGVHPLI